MDLAARMQATLRECWSWHVGEGGVKAISARLHVDRCYVSRSLRKPCPPAVDFLGRLLHELGEDEDLFFDRVGLLKTPGRDPLTILDSLPHRQPEREPIKQLIAAAKRLIVACPGVDLPGTLANIEHAEELRRSDPAEAARIAHHEALRACSWPMFCKAVGTYASACRVGADLEKAGRAIRLALRMSQRVGAGEQTRADMLIRAAYVVADHAKYPEALGLVAEAKAVYGRTGDEVGEGKCLIDRGVFSHRNGDYESARIALERALVSMPLPRSRAAAFSTLSAIYRSMGKLEEAAGALGEAEALVSASAIYDRACLRLARGEVERDLGNLSEAEKLIRASRDAVLSLNVYDGAITTIELVDVLYRLGRLTEAVTECLDMRKLLEPFRSNKIAYGAIWSLARSADESELAIELIAKARKRLKEARAQPMQTERGQKKHQGR